MYMLGLAVLHNGWRGWPAHLEKFLFAVAAISGGGIMSRLWKRATPKGQTIYVTLMKGLTERHFKIYSLF